jgi:enhancing lycopene biosynthesis protein 2
MKIGVLLSGCGVNDGSEIQEAVLTLLAIEEIGAEYVCISLDTNQYHVVNHITGEEMPETRNMLLESARIARGEIIDISKVELSEIDALVIPGGAGNAKNLSSWAFSGPDGTIRDEVKLLLVNCYNIGKPIVALCVSPVLLSLAFKNAEIDLLLSLGTTQQSTPYDIAGFHSGVIKNGGDFSECELGSILIDEKNRIICAPCYMQNAKITEINANIKTAMQGLIQLMN